MQDTIERELPFGLNSSVYRDESVLERERQRVLLPSWQIVCHESDLATPGAMLRFDFLGRSAVLLRGRDAVLRAFLNVCSHRGSRLVDGDPATGLASCVDARLRCPYHAWVYDQDGRLQHVPYAERYESLDREALGLRPVALETWRGFVFVAFETPPRSVAAMFAECDAELAPYRFEDLRRISEPRLRPREANWKVICENYLDSYHLAVAHPTLKQMVGRSYRFDGRDDIQRISGEIEAHSASTWSARAYSRWLPETAHLPRERQRLWSYYFVWPNFAFDIYPDQIDFMQMIPVAPGRTMIREIAYAMPGNERPQRLSRYLNWRVNRQVSVEDRTLIERMQLGLASGDYERGPIAADEHGLRWFNSRWRGAFEG
jgi:carnitine monooxygenase subunit